MLALAAALLAPRAAFADEAAARAHFKKAIDLYDAHDYAQALTEFQAAYGEKPSAGIKQNIALSLKGLNRPADAATAFDEALDEGKDTLKPETRAAIDRELADLSKTVATVNVTVNGDAAGTVVSIQAPDQPAHALAPGAQRRPIRLMPGIYTFSARIPGQPEPPPKKLALVSGAPVDITFGGADAANASGTLTIKVNVPEATIILDGVEVGKGSWSGPAPAKKHTIEVSAKGYRELALDVTVPAGAVVESPVTLQPLGARPPEYVDTVGTAPKWRRVYLVPMAAVDGASYRLTPVLDEPAGGTRRGFGGLSIGARIGYLASRIIGVELLAEIGDMTAKYHTNVGGGGDSSTSVVHWQITPMVRLQTPGKVRFTAGTGIGLHGLSVSSKLGRGTTTADESGDGISASWLLDSGVQIDVGPLYLEGVLFVDVHGTGTVTSDDPGNPRLLYASPGSREGLRIGLGIPF